MLIEQLIDLKKVRTDNLKFRTDLQDQVMDGWSVTLSINVYKGRLPKKSSNPKWRLVLSMLVTTWLPNITFHLQPIWLQTLFAIDSEWRQTLSPSFSEQPSEVTVIQILAEAFPSLRILGQVVDIDLLLCIGFDSEHLVLFLYHTFTQRSVTDRKIERSNGLGFGQ